METLKILSAVLVLFIAFAAIPEMGYANEASVHIVNSVSGNTSGGSSSSVSNSVSSSASSGGGHSTAEVTVHTEVNGVVVEDFSQKKESVNGESVSIEYESGTTTPASAESAPSISSGTGVSATSANPFVRSESDESKELLVGGGTAGTSSDRIAERKSTSTVKTELSESVLNRVFTRITKFFFSLIF